MALAYGKQSPQQMLEKAERDLGRIEVAEATQRAAELSDALLDFAVSLTSVKDWLKEQPSASFTPATVESYVSASAAFSSFRDIANEGKHRVIRNYVPTTQDVSASATAIVSVALHSDGTSAIATSTNNYPRLKIIRADGSRHRVVELGRAALQQWRSFIQQHGCVL